MATKASAAAGSPAAKAATRRRTPRKARRTQARPAEPPSFRSASPELPRMPKMLTPEQAIEMYKANARMALDVINAAIEGTQKLRRKQFEGEEQAREFHKKHVRAAGRPRTRRR
jgi:hypothetical protein